MLIYFAFGMLAYMVCVVLFSVVWMRWQNRMSQMDESTSKEFNINYTQRSVSEGVWPYPE